MSSGARRAGLPRWMDVLLAGVALVLTSPLLLIAAIAIKLDTRGPVFYRQQRVGLDGAMFEMLKLRTMTHGRRSAGSGIRSPPTIRASPGSARSCARRRSTSSPT